MRNDIVNTLQSLYGMEKAEKILPDLNRLLEKWSAVLEKPASPEEDRLPLDQSHIVMITYGDSVRRPVTENSAEFGTATIEPPLQTLHKLTCSWFRSMISTVHLLPCFPYTSDDGFSIADYRQIDPNLGSWEDLKALRGDFQLMLDLVLNHCSQQNSWFQKFLAGDPDYADFFITYDNPKDPQLRKVFRPRAAPLLHKFDSADGRHWVWTTFSRDQVDLNFANPKVLLEFIDIFLYYISQGAQIIRLDAVGFLWKELGTPCMHHPKTHTAVQLLRSILQALAPDSVLLTETNVPHQDNISYFGNGKNEAQMVYQFSLPPLTLNTFLQKDATHLTEWAKQLPKPNPHYTFFNFLASHDGIGILPAKGYLSPEEQVKMIEAVKSRGGKINYKSTPEGDIPYEFNINYLSAVADPDLPNSQRAKIFLAAQAILIGLAGVPGIYIHSLLGSENWLEGVRASGINRRINREKLDIRTLERELQDPDGLRFPIYQGMKNMLQIRRRETAFSPEQDQEILEFGSSLFSFRRGRGRARITCLINVTDQTVTLPGRFLEGEEMADLLSGNRIEAPVSLDPFQVLWLKENPGPRAR